VQDERFLLQPCRTSAAYEAFPKRRTRVDLALAERKLRAAGIEVLHNASVLLLVRGACEASVFENGKVLLKTTDRAIAQSEASRILGVLEAMA